MIKKILIFVCLALITNSCNINANSAALRSSKIAKHYVKKFPYKGHYKVGSPYVINNQKYTPKHDESYQEVGFASWYGEGDGFHGKLTANGDIFDRNAITAAHRTLPLPCMVRVTNLENNQTLLVMINDRGPYVKNRILDLSAKAADLLDMKKQGFVKVKVQYLPRETNILLAELSLKRPYTAQYAKVNEEKSYSNSPFNRVLANKKPGHFIQIGTYKNQKDAQQIAEATLIFGNSFIETAEETSGKKLYKVKIGPYFEKEAAVRLLDQLKNHALKGLIVAGN
jgi:rare lipoprotein A